MKLKDSASVGIFVTGAVLAFIAAVIFFTGRPIFGGHTHTFVLYFNESVNGLEVGAPVKLHGVRIGQVKKVVAHFDPGRKSVQVPVTIILEDAYWRAGRRERLRLAEDQQEKCSIAQAKKSVSVRSKFSRSPLIIGMVGSLQIESFVTGKLFVELEYVPTLASNYLRPDADGVPKIPTRPSNLESLSDQLIGIADGISHINFSTIGDSIEHIVRSLAAIDWTDLSRSVTDLFRTVANAANSDDTRRIAHSFAVLFQNLAELSTAVSQELQPALPDLRRSLANVSRSAEGLSEFLCPNSSFAVSAERLLRSADAASQAVRLFFEFLEENPRALLFGRPKDGMFR
ncbi:MAG: MlaD family protein [Puniceicoccales bacterium]|jgi:paraquat-inducible protein B|nr:MlaD family protein [Puniceicoccales bacterium]